MERPRGLTIIAWLAIIGGALQVLGSLGLVGVGSFALLIGSTAELEKIVLLGYGFPVWSGGLLIALGAIGLVFGLGMLAMKSWSWTMGIVLYAINLLAGLVLLFYTGLGWTTAFVAVLSAVVLWYLFTPIAREALGHSGGGATPHVPHPA